MIMRDWREFVTKYYLAMDDNGPRSDISFYASFTTILNYIFGQTAGGGGGVNKSFG